MKSEERNIIVDIFNKNGEKMPIEKVNVAYVDSIYILQEWEVKEKKDEKA